MPSKLDDASNLHFLYACLQTCDFPAIDYHKVAKQFGIQAPAARMRLRRLRDSLEGREGSSKVAKKQVAGDGRQGRPRGGKKTSAKEGYEKHWSVIEDDDDDDDDEDVPLGSLKFRDRGSGDGDGGFKNEHRERNHDWKTLPESSPFLPTTAAAPEARMYDMGAFGRPPADAKMLPPGASPVRQMVSQAQPQTPMYDLTEPYMYHSSQHVALPQTPYYQTSFDEYHPEQYQHRLQYQTATPPSDVAVSLDIKQPLAAEEIGGENFGDSK